MKKRTVRVYPAFAGHICTGKDTIIAELINRKNLEKIIHKEKGELVIQLPEAVNTDQAVLAEYYRNMKANTANFEFLTLNTRIILARSIENYSGIVIGNRYIPEARYTFVEHNLREAAFKNVNPYLTNADVGIYDLMWRTALDKGLEIPDLVIYLYVTDPDILIARNKKRGIAAEQNIPSEYMRSLAPYFERFRENFAAIHEGYRLVTPELLAIDTTRDIDTDPKFLDEVTAQCEEAIKKIYNKKNI